MVVETETATVAETEEDTSFKNLLYHKPFEKSSGFLFKTTLLITKIDKSFDKMYFWNWFFIALKNPKSLNLKFLNSKCI